MKAIGPKPHKERIEESLEQLMAINPDQPLTIRLLKGGSRGDHLQCSMIFHPEEIGFVQPLGAEGFTYGLAECLCGLIATINRRVICAQSASALTRGSTMATDAQKMAELMADKTELQRQLNQALGEAIERETISRSTIDRLERNTKALELLIAALAMTYGEDNGGGYWTLKVPDVAVAIAPLAMLEQMRNEAQRTTQIMIRIKGQ